MICAFYDRTYMDSDFNSVNALASVIVYYGFHRGFHLSEGQG